MYSRSVSGKNKVKPGKPDAVRASGYTMSRFLGPHLRPAVYQANNTM